MHRNKSDNREAEMLYTNTFGTVFKDNFIIHTVENRAINLDNNLRKVKLVKERQYGKNLLFFSIALITACIFYFNKDDKAISAAFGIITALMTLISMLIVEYRFKFIILRKYDSAQYLTERQFSDDAQQLALLVNKKIRANDKLFRF